MAVTVTLEELVERRKRLAAELQGVDDAIDKFRVKCPTCRCRLLPGLICGCCFDRVSLTDD